MKRKLLSVFLALCLVVGLLPLSAAAAENVNYTDENDTTQSVSAQPITESTTTLTSGAYFVDNDVTVSGMLTIADGADVKIILTKGATLTVPKGIQTAKDKTGNLSVYTDGSDAKLSVGSKTTTETQENQYYSAAIYVKGDLTLAGGTIIARDRDSSIGINSIGIYVNNGTLKIANCTVNATGGDVTSTEEDAFGTSSGCYVSYGTGSIKNAVVTATGGAVSVSHETDIDEGGQSTGFGVWNGSLKLQEDAELNCTGGAVTIAGEENSSYGMHAISFGFWGSDCTLQMAHKTAVLNAKGGKTTANGGNNPNSISSESYGIYCNDVKFESGTVIAESNTTGTINGASCTAYDIYVNNNAYVQDGVLKVKTAFFKAVDDGYSPQQASVFNLLPVGYAFYKHGSVISANVDQLTNVNIDTHTCAFSYNRDDDRYVCKCGRNYMRDPVKYLAENGIERYCGKYSPLLPHSVTDTHVILQSGWFVLSDNAAGIKVNDGLDANIIIPDGVNVTFSKGITAGENCTVTFYAQSTGSRMGKATFGNSSNGFGIAANNITVNGGDITAVQRAHPDDEGYSGSINFAVMADNLTVNGGKLTATSTKTTIADAKRPDDPSENYSVSSFGILVKKKFTVNGGTVSANGGDWDVSGDTSAMYASSYGILVSNGGKFTVKGGTVTGTGGAVNVTSTTQKDLLSDSVGIYLTNGTNWNISGGSVTANGGDTTATPASGSTSVFSSSMGAICINAVISGGSLSLSCGKAINSDNPDKVSAFDIYHEKQGTITVSGGTVIFGTGRLETLTLENDILLTDMLKPGHACVNREDLTLYDYQDLVTARRISDVDFVECTHEDQTGTCTYCNKNLTPPGTGGGYTPSYTPSVTPTTGGSTEISNTDPDEGDTVNVIPKPDDGKRIEKITVTDSSGNKLEIKRSADGSFSFTQPADEVTIEVTYGDIPTFKDVPETEWYNGAVSFVVERGVFNGMSPDTFEPNFGMTRGMFINALYNLAGNPTTASVHFDDVPDNMYYANAISWAATKGVANGVGDNKFMPDAPITREQMVTMLWNYDGKVAGGAGLEKFTDSAMVNDWALPAMKWAVANGIINGKSPTALDPLGTATRAEAATMFMNYLKK